jgi:hypothetical protein
MFQSAIMQWPSLEWREWQATAETLHMFTQIVGKTRLALTPRQNHWWNVTLYVTARGLSTSAMPLVDGDALEIEFDFLSHLLTFRRSSGAARALSLEPQSVRDFYAAYLHTLKDLAVEVSINPRPAEVANPIRFDQDTVHASYDGDAAQRFWRVLIEAEALFKRFSCNFYGKISPVHFYWGSFDLAVTRFNGNGRRRGRARIRSKPRRTHTNASVQVFGPVTAAMDEPLSIPMLLPYQSALATSP